ncbi:hypothetical protein BG846_02799 [Streptomyces fradiae ATCC 10745 = DSM 40063]|uniref:Uncharacterized protein n=1 Tax=Streptomyces fradiae ATCC 10745 = DSM 40063 TaxID=1319510 RepID=A0A1Y2NXD5_STRFR|nr:hypothetical protein BG846_02799 [Streptomyces fradiae ATCC 10745 = DSM 40063]
MLPRHHLSGRRPAAGEPVNTSAVEATPLCPRALEAGVEGRQGRQDLLDAVRGVEQQLDDVLGAQQDAVRFPGAVAAEASGLCHQARRHGGGGRRVTTVEEYGNASEPVEVVDAELVQDDALGAGAVAVPDPVDAVLAALDTDARAHLNDIRPKKTKDGYARDWRIWGGVPRLARRADRHPPAAQQGHRGHLRVVRDVPGPGGRGAAEHDRTQDHRRHLGGSQTRLHGAEGGHRGRPARAEAAPAGQEAPAARPRQSRRRHPEGPAADGQRATRAHTSPAPGGGARSWSRS